VRPGVCALQASPDRMAALQPGASASFSVVAQNGKLVPASTMRSCPTSRVGGSSPRRGSRQLVDVALDELLSLQASKLSRSSMEPR